MNYQAVPDGKENVSPIMEQSSHEICATTLIPSIGREQRENVTEQHRGPTIVSGGKVLSFEMTALQCSKKSQAQLCSKKSQTQYYSKISLISPVPNQPRLVVHDRGRYSTRLAESGKKRTFDDSMMAMDPDDSSILAPRKRRRPNTGKQAELSWNVPVLANSNPPRFNNISATDPDRCTNHIPRTRTPPARKQTGLSRNASVANTNQCSEQVCFPQKLHLFLSEASVKYPHIVSWVCDGAAFQVFDTKEMGSILGKFFNHIKYSSFQRQLNMYGWKKHMKGVYEGAFFHPDFHQNMDICTDLSLFRRRTTESKNKKNPRRTTASTGKRIPKRTTAIEDERIWEHTAPISESKTSSSHVSIMGKRATLLSSEDLGLNVSSPPLYEIQSEFGNATWSPLFEFADPSIEWTANGSYLKVTPPCKHSSVLATPCNASIDSFTCVTENDVNHAMEIDKEVSFIEEEYRYLLCEESIIGV